MKNLFTFVFLLLNFVCFSQDNGIDERPNSFTKILYVDLISIDTILINTQIHLVYNRDCNTFLISYKDIVQEKQVKNINKVINENRQYYITLTDNSYISMEFDDKGMTYFLYNQYNSLIKWIRPDKREFPTHSKIIMSSL